MMIHLIIENDYDGYTVLHAYADVNAANARMLDLIEVQRNRVRSNPEKYDNRLLARIDIQMFNYEVLSMRVE